jgi:hypothetical protein
MPISLAGREYLGEQENNNLSNPKKIWGVRGLR